MLNNLETIWLTELNINQLHDVKQLMLECDMFDKGSPIIYPSSLLHTRLPALNGLIYYQRKLVAFVSAYFFYKTACECSLMVAPNYRSRGLASGLLSSMTPTLKAQGIQSIYFSASPSFLANRYPKLQYYSCEYQLMCQLNESVNVHDYSLKFRAATLQDIDLICHLDQACFGNHEHQAMMKRLHNIVQSPHYLVLIGELNEKPIAKAHIQWQQDRATLSDIAVYPAHQRQGYGSEVVHACLVECQKKDFHQVALEVESNNDRALKLYLNHGFEVVKSTNFWEMVI